MQRREFLGSAMAATIALFAAKTQAAPGAR